MKETNTTQVPPILSALVNNAFLLDLCDLSSVNSVVTGAGGLTKELSEKVKTLRPGWSMLPAYGTFISHPVFQLKL